ncbi:FadR/GntR family transcriptional regulator [Kineococcus rhizosphaerae]|uniref:DNA-binding FadR family transcriptional regulator n=1 Tax=Kineococcus rhizosphaerae TaxID=559628 RepID=A0A2T0R1Y2_9ACTN|nr:FCD domain-containing protein [Kineococcus rhizosphaerae]PRY13572.1 DNA-binding FadR family transcriptional regulator [Kineococcus rhizosphaerae]
MRSPAFTRVLDEIGAAIVDGEFPAGSRTSVEVLVERTLASRSIVREATRVLAALGLLSASPRVGLVVRPAADWNLLDPQVVRWRLAGPQRETQLTELRELRQVLEPAAAQAAAARADPATRERLRTLAEGFDDGSGDPARFLRTDAELHDLLLRAGGNAMFVNLGAVVALAVAERAGVEPVAHDVHLHAVLARAVADGDAVQAADVMREIVTRTSAE